ncbi:thioredoxin family protein [Pontixanthobacter sp. CEM42]|uniref:thioredoxin family protein n=1 Tax=Pontixanthobacter sp. CEM42 TaxID=2792077 RepID=UPI001AE021D0|nr:thioredoxin family protein [Pontixanthobacter sp. CEM42]
MKKLLSIVAAFAALFALTPAAAAPGWTDYSASTFTAAQNAGKTIVVDVHANWCPTCKAQQPILNELRADKRLKGAVFIKVDFDQDKAFLRTHRVPRQSTILVFKGKKETARSIAQTNRTALRTVVLNAI